MKYDYQNSQTTSEAFIFLLQEYLKETKEDSLENLFFYVNDYYKKSNFQIDLSKKNFLDLINSNQENLEKENLPKNLQKDFNIRILSIAYQCINNGKNLGEFSKDKIHNSSEWISHSLYVAQFSSELASYLGLDPNIAKQLGILHDIGRVKDHSFKHGIIGYNLVKKSVWNKLAFACIGHSYMDGKPCANNEPPLEGWYIDKDGNGCFDNNFPKDSATILLENHSWNSYDQILCIADLLATSKGITTPEKRIADIATRRKGIDEQPNRSYFLINLSNALLEIMNINKEYKKIPLNTPLEIVKKEFARISTEFFQFYNTGIKKSLLSTGER